MVDWTTSENQDRAQSKYGNHICKADIHAKRDQKVGLEILKQTLHARIEYWHDQNAQLLRDHPNLDSNVAEEMIAALRNWVDYHDFFEPLTVEIDNIDTWLDQNDG